MKIGLVIIPCLLVTGGSLASERFDVARSWQGQQINLRPELFMPPQADKPVPVMVVLHGSAGLKPAHVELAREFTKMGVAGGRPGYFLPRKERAQPPNHTKISPPPRVIFAARTAH